MCYTGAPKVLLGYAFLSTSKKKKIEQTLPITPLILSYNNSTWLSKNTNILACERFAIKNLTYYKIISELKKKRNIYLIALLPMW